MADFYKARKPDGKQTVVEFATDAASATPGIGVALDGSGKISADFIPAIPGITVSISDEGVLISNPVETINFVGNGVTATAVGGDVTVTIPIGQSDIDNLQTLIGALDVRVTTSEGNISNNAANIATNASSISSLEGDQVTQDNRLTTLESRAGETDTEQTVQDGRLSNLETRADVTDTEQFIQDGRLTTLEGDQTVQDGRLDTLEIHPPRTDNPHNVTAAQVGLGNVDNTSDLDKPISIATQTALDGKSDINHTHLEADITDLDKYTQAQVDASQAIQDNRLTSLEDSVNNFNQELEILAFVSCNC